MTAKIIGILQQKGGVGKTTTAVNLGHGLALTGKNVLIIDLDPQGQVSTQLGVDQTSGAYKLFAKNVSVDKVVVSGKRPNLWIIPGDIESTKISKTFQAQEAGIDELANILRPIAKNPKLDYVIIDTAPSAGDLQNMVVYASDYVLIPSECQYGSSDGIVKMEGTMARIVKSDGWTGKVMGVLPTKYKEVRISFLKNRYADACLPPIHDATIFARCFGAGLTIYEVPNTEKDEYTERAKDEYTNVVKHVLRTR
jgi:chromosome partitioning protein